jgi:hypothetical protein
LYTDHDSEARVVLFTHAGTIPRSAPRIVYRKGCASLREINEQRKECHRKGYGLLSSLFILVPLIPSGAADWNKSPANAPPRSTSVRAVEQRADVQRVDDIACEDGVYTVAHDTTEGTQKAVRRALTSGAEKK